MIDTGMLISITTIDYSKNLSFSNQ